MESRKGPKILNERTELYKVQLLIKHYENVIVQLVPDSSEWNMIFTKLLELKLVEGMLEEQIKKRLEFEEEAKDVMIRKAARE